MSTLIILGNININTFVNSIVAANAKAIEIFQDPLTNIYVIHSAASFEILQKERTWINHLKNYDIGEELFIDRTIEITPEKDSLSRFVDYLEFIVKGQVENSNLFVDLTNGTSLQKNLLSIATYILDIRNQYIIDTVKLIQLTKEKGFLPVNILLSSYVSLPDSTYVDSIAYLNLSEIIRYRRVIESHAKKYVEIDRESSDEKFFVDNLSHSIQLKLQGDRSRDNAVYRIAAASISASVEDLISLLLKDQTDRNTFGKRLNLIYSKLQKCSPQDFDFEFLKKFNDFILYLRNSSTHKGRLLTDLERFKADLSVKMSFPFIEFYTDIVHPALSSENSDIRPMKISIISDSEMKKEEGFYYGLDGDDTGLILEDLFVSASDESKFRKLSQSVT
jgi:hypothetical protein